MRILLVIYGSLEQQTGGYRYDARLVALLESRGHQVTLLSQTWGSPVRRLLEDRPKRIVKRAREAGAQLILEDELNHLSLRRSNRRLRRELGVPIVSIVHHLASREEHSRLGEFLLRPLEREYLETVDGAIYNTSVTRDDVAGLLGRELPGVVCLPSAEGLREPGLMGEADVPGGGRGLRLLSVGSLIRRKRIDAVIEAVSLLRDEPVSLTVVGSREAEPATARALYTLTRRLGLEERVTFAGSLTSGELAAAYRDHDLLVLVSQYEGFGMVYLEAMAHGTPVIASEAGGAREIVRDGYNGFLCRAGSAPAVAAQIRRLLREPELRENLASGARRTAASHPTWEESFDSAEAYLREMRGVDGL